jgi:hypothetical protein
MRSRSKARSLEDLSTPEQILVLRDSAKALRAGKTSIKPEYQDELADMCEDAADRIEAGEDPFAEEEESLEQLQAEADAARKIAELLKRENVETLGELFEPDVSEEDLN